LHCYSKHNVTHQRLHLDVAQQAGQVQQLGVKQAQELIEVDHTVLVHVSRPAGGAAAAAAAAAAAGAETAVNM
jgi:hypothetical protein